MIIGISGKLGSGKDTVAKIIQDIDPTIGWEIKKYADKLKQIASILTGIPREKFEDQNFKLTNLPEEWNNATYEYNNNGDAELVVKPMTVREFLQKLGTDAMRFGLHKDVWVNGLMVDYIPKILYGKGTEFDPFEYKYSNWIITDVRFPNEALAILRKSGHLIRVIRPGFEDTGTHESETALDNYEFDNVIVNDGNLTDLIEKVREVYENIKSFA